MNDLSLHLLDLMENSLRAGASVIAVSLVEDIQRDILKITLEDNGQGLDIPPAAATDPFFTTKEGKATGLGLSLMQASAERAGGTLALERSASGGLRVVATMHISHVDRCPLGDMGATFASVAITHPELDLQVSFVSDGRMAMAQLIKPAGIKSTQQGIEQARKFAEQVGVGVKILQSYAGEFTVADK